MESSFSVKYYWSDKPVYCVLYNSIHEVKLNYINLSISSSTRKVELKNYLINYHGTDVEVFPSIKFYEDANLSKLCSCYDVALDDLYFTRNKYYVNHDHVEKFDLLKYYEGKNFIYNPYLSPIELSERNSMPVLYDSFDDATAFNDHIYADKDNNIVNKGRRLDYLKLNDDQKKIAEQFSEFITKLDDCGIILTYDNDNNKITLLNGGQVGALQAESIYDKSEFKSDIIPINDSNLTSIPVNITIHSQEYKLKVTNIKEF